MELLDLIDAGSEPGSADFVLVAAGASAPLLLSAADFPGVHRAAADLSRDIERVTGVLPDVEMAPAGEPRGRPAVWIGTLGRHPGIDDAAARGELDTSALEGRREAWRIQHLRRGPPGSPALVISGSDKRGTIYGIYALSRLIGVSAWYYWADVPVPRRERLVFGPGERRGEEPAVRYRGIFLNDEEPALGGWARERFGGFNGAFYARVFELLLRLGGNFLWPAMWGSAFNEDDEENPRLADHYGIVMGTSHHEPMLRSQQEWKRHGRGPWSYATNREELSAFWRHGIERNRDFESAITLGMRGDGDLPMSEAEDRALLESVFSGQSEILAEVLAEKAADVPRVWALYKEVQAYFDRGMRVPDDVTLLFCDDNWGNLRRVPSDAERQRSGGAGIYYHYDYVGGPRSYKWLCTAPIEKTWEQMQLAYAHGADRLWIVNVGDLKPMEFAIEFFLDLARAPSAMTLEALAAYPEVWAAQQFGPEHAAEIGRLLTLQSRFIARRKPELLEPETFSLVSYREAERVLAEYRALEAEALALAGALPEAQQAAYFQLVLYPVQASANLIELMVTVGQNRLYALQGRASTNALFERARELFRKDAELAARYEALLDGKWRHMMAQNHIGYTYWQQPVRSALPAVTEVALPAGGSLGVAIEGSERAWPTDDPNQSEPVLPALDPLSAATAWIDVFSRGRSGFRFTATCSAPWLRAEPEHGVLGGGLASEQRVEVSVDWHTAPPGEQLASVRISGPGAQHVEVQVPIWNPTREKGWSGAFVETGRRLARARPASASPSGEAIAGRLGGGYISMEAEHFSRAVSDPDVSWRVIPGHGRTLSGVTPFPVTARPRALGRDAARLEYRVFVFSPGPLEVTLYVSPSLDFVAGRALRCGLSFDGAAPQLVEIVPSGSAKDWARSVEDAVRKVSVRASLDTAGEHVLSVWMVDPGVVLQKIVIDLGGLAPCYLGPPESPVG